MTYAIFRAAGFQYRAELGDVLRLPAFDVEAGEAVTFDEVLLGVTDGEVLVGRPTVEGASVRAEVLRHGRADKVVVFKFKRRKNYRRKTGHRQGFTEVRVNEIDLGGDRRATLGEGERRKKKTAAPAKARKKKTTTAKAATARAKPKTSRKRAPTGKTRASAAKGEAKTKTSPKAKSAAKSKTPAKAKSSSKSKKKS